MRLLIDGYNLIHAVGLLDRKISGGVLEKARQELLRRLAESLTPEEAGLTLVVFDAAQSLDSRPTLLHFQNITIRFAADHAHADELIIDTIQSHPDPRRLTVVSSDHQIQIAARRRKATTIDSDEWWYARKERKPSAPKSSRHTPASQDQKPEPPDDITNWLEVFRTPKN